ncbi:MAG: hypothetical protein WCQ95_14365 [Bacteroidota bacterium]
MSKLTENEIVLFLIDHLKKQGWTIDSFCLGQQKGNDIVASKNGKTLIVEAKGAKADDKSPNKKREQFKSGQVKKHFVNISQKKAHSFHRRLALSPQTFTRVGL